MNCAKCGMTILYGVSGYGGPRCMCSTKPNYDHNALADLLKERDMLKAENERLSKELRIAQMRISAQGWELARAERTANPFHGMYQDAEGKIPVTSAGQPVGRVEYGNGSVGVQFNAANRPTAMPCGDALIDPGTWLEIDK